MLYLEQGTSTSLLIMVGVVIFGIFVTLAYFLFEDKMSPQMAKIYDDALGTVQIDTSVDKNPLTGKLIIDRWFEANQHQQNGNSVDLKFKDSEYDFSHLGEVKNLDRIKLSKLSVEDKDGFKSYTTAKGTFKVADTSSKTLVIPSDRLPDEQTFTEEYNSTVLVGEIQVTDGKNHTYNIKYSTKVY